MTRSRAKGLTNFKPIKQKKGIVISLSDDSDSPPERHVAQGSTSKPIQEDSTPLNTLADAATQHSVSAALATMVRMIRREPECDPSPAQPPVTTIHAPTITRDTPIEFNFMDSPHFTFIPISSTTVEPTIIDHPATTKTVSRPSPVETTTTSPIPSPIKPINTPSTPTEPVIPLLPTVSIQELDFVLGLSPTNPSLTLFEHNEHPSNPQNTPVTQTPPPSPHFTQPFIPSPNQPTSPIHSGTHDYYEGAHFAHHSPEHSSPHVEQEREEVDTRASLRKKVARKRRMSKVETRCLKRRIEGSERPEAEERASRRRKRPEQQFEEGPGF
ncbi:mucin-2-like [Cynara cardunculus var. scolymus]|uniref:mucin-2-like n=1 Tax=Cynara cardunculus var. scolymus TaxID=59895 RepID=UPI000D623E61|nr:mucin-2-like [Cynara cardunculus var. scolymus]